IRAGCRTQRGHGIVSMFLTDTLKALMDVRQDAGNRSSLASVSGRRQPGSALHGMEAQPAFIAKPASSLPIATAGAMEPPWMS
ncbi:MAG: hypothetical protein WCK58_13670, partial [Chloroflexota bacterium]